MKSKNTLRSLAIAVVVQLGMIAGSAQTNIYRYTGYETNITLAAGTSNVVIQASTDLHTWIPLQTNLLGSGPLYSSDSQSTTNTRRFYRAQLSP